jgi:hypothetical protein
MDAFALMDALEGQWISLHSGHTALSRQKPNTSVVMQSNLLVAF